MCSGRVTPTTLRSWRGVKQQTNRQTADRPTVSLNVTSVVACTYGCDDGRISPTRCAVIAAGLGDRCSPRRACSRLPAGARRAHSALAAGSRPGSPADPGGSHRSRTRPRSGIRSYGDASPAKWVGSGRVTLRHVSPIPPLDPYVRLSPHTAHERGTFTGNFHFANSTEHSPWSACAFVGYLCTVSRPSPSGPSPWT